MQPKLITVEPVSREKKENFSRFFFSRSLSPPPSLSDILSFEYSSNRSIPSWNYRPSSIDQLSLLVSRASNKNLASWRRSVCRFSIFKYDSCVYARACVCMRMCSLVYIPRSSFILTHRSYLLIFCVYTIYYVYFA